MTQEKKTSYCRQNLNLFIKEFLGRCRNGPRAIWKVTENQEVIYRDTPADSQSTQKLMKNQISDLVGVYDTRCKASDLFSDLRLGA